MRQRRKRGKGIVGMREENQELIGLLLIGK
jgi:hypothetical protein